MAASGEPAGSGRAQPAAPVSLRGLLEIRDFRLLCAGRSVSLLGDGAFLLALTWEAYTLSGVPAAMSLLGLAMSAPLLALLLLGGVASDRTDRRKVMLRADLVRFALLCVLGGLTLAGAVRLWEIAVLVAIYGGAQAFFDPSSDAILPEIVADSHLGSANALDQVIRPLALRLGGPALGGLLISAAGTGAAFLLDAGTFLISAATLRAMSGARAAPADGAPGPSLGAELRAGWSYVSSHVWLWGTFASAGIAYLLFMGPVEVLVPYIVKNQMGGSGEQLGLVLAAGGVASVLAGATMLRSGSPSRSILFIYSTWGVATLAIAGFGLAGSLWQLMLASVAFNALETAGTIVWATLKQERVPGPLLGRVSSVDWLVSSALLPLSFALTSPVTALLGARTTLIVAGCSGAAVTLGGLLLPGMVSADERGRLGVGVARGALRGPEGA